MRFCFLDSLRGVAAVLVYFVHSVGFVAVIENQSFASSLLFQLSKLGHQGVFVFFVISGYVLPMSLDRGVPRLRGLPNFVLRRSIRLDPPYWAAIAVATAILLFRSSISSSFSFSVPPATTFVAHVFYLQGILGIGHLNVVFWTLCLEVQFYLLIYLVYTLRGRWAGFEIRELVTLGLVLASLALTTTSLGANNAFLPSVLFSFLVGTIVYESTHSVLFARLVLPTLAGTLLLSTPAAMTSVVTGLAIFVATRSNGHAWLKGGVWAFYGKISYSFYLVHGPVCIVGLAAFNRLGRRDSGLLASSASLGTFFVATFAAWVFYRLVERPSMKLAARLRPQRRDQPSSARDLITPACATSTGDP